MINIVCQSLGRQCGIAEYSTTLTERFRAIGEEVNLYTSPSQIDSPGTTIIQVEASFYNSVSDVLNGYVAARRWGPVILDSHAGESLENVLVNPLKGAFLGCKTNPPSGAYLLRLIDHPPSTTPDPGPPADIHLAAFGFMLPNKKYEDVISLSKRLDVPLTIIAPEANANNAALETSQRYKSEIQALDGFELITDFLPKEEVIATLRQSSHIISTMSDLGRRPTWSLRMAATAGRPIISTPGFGPEEIGCEIVNSLDDIDVGLLAKAKLPTVPDTFGDYTTLLEIARQSCA